MSRIITIIFLLFLTISIYSQNSLTGKVTDEHTGEPIPGVNVFVTGTLNGTATGVNGEFELTGIENETYKILFSHIAYKDLEIELDFPLNENFIEIELEEEAEETDEIVVNATRSSRTIENEPTRVEVIAGEEIDEKISMDPSNISMMLNESTGIQVQQTSAASANNTFRIQGLEGRFTQLLKDGFPLYSGFSGSLSIVQVPPLDLKQIEIIKGSSSTLYGGGAIAGLINLISKEPKDEREISFLVNGTSAGGLDLSGYYSARNNNIGVTFLAGYNLQEAYDNNDDKFSDLPQIRRYVLNPKLYFYLSEKSSLEAGINFIKEERIGGAIPEIDSEHDPIYTYSETNESERISSQVRFQAELSGNQLTIKNSVGYFNRKLFLPDYSFSGEQVSSYSEAVYQIVNERSSWILGLNFITENFDEKNITNLERDFSDLTAGAFLQNNLEIDDQFSLETGMRADHNFDYGWFLLPRIALLSRWTDKFSTRVGGGLGYKIPSIFTEDAEGMFFRNVLSIDKNEVKAEKSYGANIDFNYSTIFFDEVTLSVNQLFFYTRINDPLRLTMAEEGKYQFVTDSRYIDTRGFETNLKFTYNHFKFFAGYSYADVELVGSNASSEFVLTPKHNLGLVLIYEQHGNLRIGLEGYYTGKQKQIDGTETTDYWVNGIMIEKRFGNIRLFLNFENIFDTKQANYGPMFTGTPSDPVFFNIYAPTDGRIINGGVKIKL